MNRDPYRNATNRVCLRNFPNKHLLVDHQLTKIEIRTYSGYIFTLSAYNNGCIIGHSQYKSRALGFGSFEWFFSKLNKKQQVYVMFHYEKFESFFVSLAY